MLLLLCAGDPTVAESGDAGFDVQTEREGLGVGECHYSRVSWRGGREGYGVGERGEGGRGMGWREEEGGE